jgi:hypothetical protein
MSIAHKLMSKNVSVEHKDFPRGAHALSYKLDLTLEFFNAGIASQISHLVFHFGIDMNGITSVVRSSLIICFSSVCAFLVWSSSARCLSRVCKHINLQLRAAGEQMQKTRVHTNSLHVL